MPLPNPKPIEIRRLSANDAGGKQRGTGLKITWSGGEVGEISSKTLRMNCPCATCNEQRGDRTHAKPLEPRTPAGGRSLLKVIKSDVDEETDLQEVWPIGNYAIGMRWADQHDTGIYPYALLCELSENSDYLAAK